MMRSKDSWQIYDDNAISATMKNAHRTSRTMQWQRCDDSRSRLEFEGSFILAYTSREFVALFSDNGSIAGYTTKTPSHKKKLMFPRSQPQPQPQFVLNGQSISEAFLLPSRTTDSGLSKYSSVDDNLSDNKWKIELAWLSRALEPALQLCRRALPGGNDDGRKPLPNTRSLSEIVSSIQRSKIGIQDWSLSDLTVGLFLIYLRQASADQIEDIEGTQISCDSTVENFIYHVELAKGAYRENAAGLAKNSMLREHDVLKFIKNSSVMRPGYYIGIDHRNKLVILGIRGTHTVYDLITDILSSSEREVSFEGYSTHFGTAEAARWFLNHEIDTIRKCISKHEGFKLRLVGHSLGGATASLLAIMLRKTPEEELGFSPDIVTAVGFATPPCVSKKLAESCSDYVSTIVMQDDIIPRLSASSLKSLRNEILHTDCQDLYDIKERWGTYVDKFAHCSLFLTDIQEMQWTYHEMANNVSIRWTYHCKNAKRKKLKVKHKPIISMPSSLLLVSRGPKEGNLQTLSLQQVYKLEECHRRGCVVKLQRGDKKSNDLSTSSSAHKVMGCYTLWKRVPGEHFQRIVLSSNLISDHRCDNHYYALRDVLKGLPHSDPNSIISR
ncbi:hypothetical protein Syun_007032 [Stephania yunnanensis]|uniref:Fungal lipase-type domain-containing protein n=1 Tax=Stephania yunnanensis TaxID=152371 RepID=A0AAP0Q1Z8_9MAGN